MKSACVSLCALLCLTACSTSRPSVDEALQSEATAPDTPGHEPGSVERAADEIVVLSIAATEARTRAKAAPKDVEAQVAAAHALFLVADLKARRAHIADLGRTPPRDVRELFAREDALADDIKAEVVTLAGEGAAFAKAALALEPDRADARLHYATCLGLAAWGTGVVAAILAGLGGKVERAIEAAVAIDETYSDAAPLRLQGAFLGRAPWPYGDKKKARVSLEKAVQIAPICINHLFLAEVLFRTGDAEAAKTNWRLALRAPAGDQARIVTDLQRDIARRALSLVE